MFPFRSTPIFVSECKFWKELIFCLQIGTIRTVFDVKVVPGFSSLLIFSPFKKQGITQSPLLQMAPRLKFALVFMENPSSAEIFRENEFLSAG